MTCFQLNLMTVVIQIKSISNNLTILIDIIPKSVPAEQVQPEVWLAGNWHEWKIYPESVQFCRQHFWQFQQISNVHEGILGDYEPTRVHQESQQ